MNEFYYVTRVKIKHKDDTDNEYFGRGVADLLRGVEEYASLNLAAQHMGMAYSKAWKIVRQAEAALRLPLLYRMRKSGSRLTEEGKKLLCVYEEAEKAALEAVDHVIEHYYGDGKNAGSDESITAEKQCSGDGF